MEYRLDELFDLQMGKTPSRNNSEYWDSEDHKWISIADLSKCGKYIYETKEYLSDKAVAESGISQIPANTVIMSFKLSIGKTAITPEPMYSNEAIMSFRDKKVIPLLPDYIFYLFSGRDWETGTNKAVMGKTLNKATLSQIKIRVHSLPEQQEIVHVLDKTTAIIDARLQELQKLDELVKARFVEMFGDVKTNDKNWQTKPLKELCDISRGGSPRPIADFLGGTIPWIKIGDATDGDYIYINSTKEHIIEEGVRKSRFVKSGSLIFANCGVSLGFCRIINFDGCIHDGWLAFQNIDEALDKVFLLMTINQLTDYFRSIAPGGTQPNLNTEIMGNYQQIVPPMELQQKYIEFVKQIDKSKVVVQKALDEAQTLFDSLMQKYFS